MACISPYPMEYINLRGENLGLRHKYLNELVMSFYEDGVPFEEIENHPEKTPIDRLLKIDFASKLRNIDYMLKNLKDEDMLYASKALKAKWMIEDEYQDIINPIYLENNLYPYMVTTAISKFKNWLYLNLKEPQRCAEFYKFYSDANFKYAIKFLGHCEVNFIMHEASKVLEKLSPHNFKVLCERCPIVAIIYFENIPCNDKLKTKFLDNQIDFFKSLRVVLTSEPDLFFEITEKYFDIAYSRALTKYIMKNHRDRFYRKQELYAGKLLNMQTVARCLTSKECKKLVLKLARASYLSKRFDYHFVKPLIKRIPISQRDAFKKRVFVIKDVGELIKTWPYEIPSTPKRNSDSIHVFEDKVYPRFVYREKEHVKWKIKECLEEDEKRAMNFVEYYLFDKLFNKYIHVDFERSLYELEKKIKKESSPMNRLYMMLMLVNKTEGDLKLVASLLQLLKHHRNELAFVRAAVVRGLVKCAAIWRLPQRSWDTLMQFARGLGLDGSAPEADCREGLHAVVMRNLLTRKSECNYKQLDAILPAFLRNFSLLDEYPINVKERRLLMKQLNVVLKTIIEVPSCSAELIELLGMLFKVLRSRNITDESLYLIPTVAGLVKRDPSATKPLLLQLYKVKIARRTLFRENFPLLQTDASYVNALRHDPSVLDMIKFVELVEKNQIRPEQFLRKLTVYFAWSLGMMEIYRTELRERVLTNPSVGRSIARPLSLLQGACLPYLQTLDVKNKTVARFASALKANMHAGRPKLDMNEISLSAVGAKAVANKVLVCPSAEVDHYIQILLKWKRTVRVALVLAERTGKEADVYVAAAALRPTATLKAALKYLRRRGADFDPRVWELFKQLLNDFDLCSEKHLYIRESFKNFDKIPSTIKPAYCAILFKALNKDFYYDALSILSDMEHMLPDVDEDFLEQELLYFLEEYKYHTCKQSNKEIMELYIRIFAKFLLLCKTDEIQEKRCKSLCASLLMFLELYIDKSKKDFMKMFDLLLLSLQYNKVFFDESYVSPLPVLEIIISWMRRHLPLEIHFDKYVCIHLTMLYLASIRQSMKSQLGIFKNEKRKSSEAMLIVGYALGENIAREMRQLKKNYFESAIELYRTGIKTYFTDYFEHDVTKFKFIKLVVTGILQGSIGDEVRLALYILKDINCNFDPTDIKDLISDMKIIRDETFKYFLYYELYFFRNYLVE